MFLVPQVLVVLASVSFSAAHNVDLTKDDIPSDLPADLRKMIERTFSDKVTFSPDAVERAVAAKEIGEMRERPPPPCLS